MQKTVLYRYLGTNGTIESPVHLEDIYYVRVIRLTADPGKRMTNGVHTLAQVTVPEEEIDLWSEIDWVPSNNK